MCTCRSRTDEDPAAHTVVEDLEPRLGGEGPSVDHLHEGKTARTGRRHDVGQSVAVEVGHGDAHTTPEADAERRHEGTERLALQIVDGDQRKAVRRGVGPDDDVQTTVAVEVAGSHVVATVPAVAACRPWAETRITALPSLTPVTTPLGDTDITAGLVDWKVT